MKVIFEYWGLITEYISPFKIIFTGVLYSLIAAALVLLLLLLLRKQVLVKRRFFALKYLAYFYFVMLPILAGYFGFQYGTIHSIQKNITANMPKYTNTINGIFVSNVKNDVDQLVSKFNPNDPIPYKSANEYVDMLSGMIYVDLMEALNSAKKGDGVQATIASKLQSWLSDSSKLSGFVKKQLHQLISSKLKVEDGLTYTLLSTRVDELLSEGAVDKLAISYIDQLFGGWKNTTLIMFILLMLLPTTEIAIANIRKDKK